jgi:hypothetical protein
MSTRVNAPAAGFHWLRRAINVGRHNPRALFGAASMLMAVWLLPTVLQLGLHVTFKPGEGAAIVIAALMTLLSMATLVPLMAGYLRLLDASERGRPAHAREVFQIFHSGPTWRACVNFSLMMLLVHLGVVSLLASQLDNGVLDWYFDAVRRVQEAQQAGAGAKPPVLPPPPEGTASLVGLSSLWLLLFGCAFAVGLGQIALTGRGARAAVADGFVGTVKNLVPLLVMAVLGFGAMVVAMVGLAIVLVVVGGVAGLVHPVLAAAVLLPLYVAFVTVAYALLLSVMYQLWRDIAGQDASPVEPATPGQLAA